MVLTPKKLIKDLKKLLKELYGVHSLKSGVYYPSRKRFLSYGGKILCTAPFIFRRYLRLFC